MTHCVKVVAKTLYKVYIEDEECELTDARVEEMAKQEFLNGEGIIDDDFEVEEQDIVGVWYDYNF